AIVSDFFKFLFQLILLPVFRCTGTMTDRGKHSDLSDSGIALSPGCHRIGGLLSPTGRQGDRDVTRPPTGQTPWQAPPGCRHSPHTRRIPAARRLRITVESAGGQGAVILR